jgi:hypothetical protein
MAEKKQSAKDTAQQPPVKKKKINAYDEPFGNEITASYPEDEVIAPKAEEKPPIAKSVKNESEAFDKEDKKTSSDEESGERIQKKSPKKTSDGEKKKAASGASPKKESAHVESSTATPYRKKTAASKKDAKEKAPQDNDEPRSSRPAHRVLPFVLAAFALFIGASLLLNLFCNQGNVLSENPSAHWMGLIGYYICNVLFGIFGPAVFTLPLLLLNLAIY